jgi:hypothetical protein
VSTGGRQLARQKMVRRTGLISAGLVVLALLLLLAGHWLVAIIFAVPAVVSVWLFLQARSVR